MTEAFNPIPEEVTKPSLKDKLFSRNAQKGEIRVGDSGFFIVLIGAALVSEGQRSNSVPEMVIGSGIAGVVLLEAVITSLRKKSDR